MDPSWLANFNNIVVENTARKSSLMVANFKLFKELDKNKKEIKRLKKSLKHKDQQMLALRNYISEMKRENPITAITNDANATGILDSFENMKVDEEPTEPNDHTPEDVEKRKYLK